MNWFKIGDEVTYHLLEKLVKWLLSSLGIWKPTSPEQKPGVTTPDEQKDDRLDWHLIINNDEFMPLENRKNLDTAIRELADDDERDRAEQLIGIVLTQGKDGYFRSRPLTTTEKSARPPKGGKGTVGTTEKTTIKEVFPAGFEPEMLTKRFLMDSTKTVEAAKLMLARLLQKSRKQKAEETTKKAALKTEEFIRKGARKALWILAAYLVVLIGSGVAAYTQLSDALQNPTNASSLAWGMVAFALFFWLVSPFLKLILPKE